MTLGEALTLFRIEKPCQFDDDLLIRRISELERTACEEIFLTHENPPAGAVDFEGYNHDTPLDTELLIPAPFDGVYGEYLSMKADLLFGDTARYNNSASVFYNDYTNFASAYNRSCAPLSGADAFLTY